MIKKNMLMQIFPHCMKRSIAPAKDKDKRVLMHTDGKLDNIFPILYDLGIHVDHPVELESSELAEVNRYGGCGSLGQAVSLASRRIP